ncbi:MAG: magnesium transporter [Lachnospiraceae bacterium]|jgi:magnesium transporter|nr:magnesium transporter [Lachnospiraceae bacterium]
MNEKRNYVEEILTLMRGKNSPKVLKDAINEYHGSDLADAMTRLDVKERQRFYRVLSNEHLAEVLEYTENADEFLEEMSLARAAQVIEKMESDEAVDLLKESDSPKKEAWLELMDPETRKNLQHLAAFDEDMVASRMTTNYVVLESEMTVKEAMKSLIEQAKECDNVSVLYVLDSEGIYYGAIDLKDIITSAGDRTLDDLVMTSYPYVYGEEKIEDCIETLKDYSEESIPVLDEDNHILGVLTAQDVTEIVDDSMGEDYAKLGGLSAEEDLEEPLLDSIKKRLPWLMLLLVLGMVVSSVVGLFEKVVAQLTVVMLFQSLILDMAGNVGTQSLAVTIRVLMDEQLTGREKLKLIWKEVRVGSANGIVLGILALAGVGVYLMLFKHLALFAAFAVSGCIGISLVVAMLISSFVGTAVPIFFKQVGVDPAAASGPLITTITDMVGVVTYYGLSWILLIQLLGM